MINKNIDLKKIAKENSNKYICENPYPHIVIDNFFDEEILTEVLKEFKISESKETIFNNPNEKKIALNRWEDFGERTLVYNI